MNVVRGILIVFSVFFFTILKAQEQNCSFCIRPEIPQFIISYYCNELQKLQKREEIKNILDTCYLILMVHIPRRRLYHYLQVIDECLLHTYKKDAPIPRVFLTALNRIREERGKSPIESALIYKRPSLYQWWYFNNRHNNVMLNLDIHGSVLAGLNNLNGIDCIPGIQSVSRINMAHHSFHEINTEFHNLTGLKSLFLTHNNIQSVTDKSFDGCALLCKIDLSHNSLEGIGGAFKNLACLQELILEDNKIKYLAADSFQGCTQIQIININQNCLESLHKACSKLATLQRLFCAQNYLKNLDKSDFEGDSELTYLNISSNNLKSITGIFHNLSKLRQIDLSYNAIESLPENTCANAPMLQSIFLSHNNIQKIDIRCFEQCDSLREIYIKANPLPDEQKQILKKKYSCLYY